MFRVQRQSHKLAKRVWPHAAFGDTFFGEPGGVNPRTLHTRVRELTPNGIHFDERRQVTRSVSKGVTRVSRHV